MEIEADDLNQLLALSKNVLSKLELRDVKDQKDKSLAMEISRKHSIYFAGQNRYAGSFLGTVFAQLPKLNF
ncbi:MAG: hypothetical protein R3C26_10800 [Calditrichia bacterium]